VNYKVFRRPTVVFTFLGITSLLLIAVFLFRDSHNTHRWIKFGGFSFQPSEVAKPALILYLAYFLETRWQQITDVKNVLLPAAAPTLLFALLIVKEPDLGTALACIAISTAVLYVAGMNMKYLWAGAVASLVPLYFLIVRVPWRWARMQAYLDPFKDPQGKGFHIIQSMIAVSTGGLTGLGLMEGKQKLFYLPEPHTDFIFAVTAEELGLWGSVLVVTLFGIFLYRGVRTALRTEDMFGKFLATGITAMVVVQALFNISVVLALVPAKGIPLPFISYGGTSLFITLATVGVLLNVSQQAG